MDLSENHISSSIINYFERQTCCVINWNFFQMFSYFIPIFDADPLFRLIIFLSFLLKTENSNSSFGTFFFFLLSSLWHFQLIKMSKWSGQQLNNDDNHVFTAGQTFKWIECYYAITSNVQLIYNNNCIQGNVWGNETS